MEAHAKGAFCKKRKDAKGKGDAHEALCYGGACMKKLFFGVQVLALFAIALLPACNGARPVSGTERDAVLAYAEPKTDNLVSGYNSGDYAVFARDFDDAMLKAENQAVFVQTRTQLLDKLGMYVSRTVTDVVRQDQYVVVLYNAKFEKADNVTVRLVFHPDGEHQVTGLWFNSPSLQ